MNYELCVCELEVILEMNQSNVSRHLGVLRNAKAIAPIKDAQWVHYKINEDFHKINEPLLRFLEIGFEKESIFIQDIKRCRIYKNSDYSCQDITSDKKRVLDYIIEKLG
jgi:ArsR family transcriptional regulator